VKIAIDIDGTIDAAPRPLQSVMSALKANGHTVVVLTGTQNGDPTPEDFEQKANYLNSLGCGSACYDQLEILNGTKHQDLAELKGKWCKDNGVDILIDNDKDNAKAASADGVPLVLVPWASRQGGKRMATINLEQARLMTGEERAAAAKSFDDVKRAVYAAVMLSPAGSDDLWLCDVGFDYAVWTNFVTNMSWRTGYKLNDDGSATLTGAIEPVAEETSWVTADRAIWSDEEYRKKLTSAAANDLPDSAFAYIEPGGTKDNDGNTTPKSKRHFPIHDAAHVRNALARLSSSPFGDKAAGKVKAAAKKFGIAVADDSQSNSAKQINEMRQAETYKDMRELLDGAVTEKFGTGADTFVYLSDFTDDWLVYEIKNEKFQVSYSVDGTTVTLGDSVQVTEIHTYTPMDVQQNSAEGATEKREPSSAVNDNSQNNVKTCDTCGGSGTVSDNTITTPCPTCNGVGTKHRSRSGFRSRKDLPARDERRAWSATIEIRDVADVSSNKATLHGVPIVYGKRYKVVDQFGEFRERMNTGCTDTVISAKDFDCRFLYNHDGMVLARSLAGTLECANEADGLHVYPTLDLRQPSAMDLYVGLETRSITQMSIGFKIAKDGDEWRRASDGVEERDIFAIGELTDVSAVAYPCSTDTSITIARNLLKGAGDETRERIRKAFGYSKDLRADRLTQADGERLMTIFRELYEAEEYFDEVTVTPITEQVSPANDERTRQQQQLTLARSKLLLPKV
jgi:HK97 family phage prohead protease